SRQHNLGASGAFLAVGLGMSGDSDAAMRLMQSERAQALTDPAARLRLWVGVFTAMFAAGRLPQIESLGLQVRHAAAGMPQLELSGWFNYCLGKVAYEWDQLDLATECFDAVIARPDLAYFYPLRGSFQGRALIHQLRGEPGAATRIADRMVDMA